MPAVPDSITNQYPLLTFFLILVCAFAGGGFGFVKWLLGWQEKQSKEWREFMAEQNAKHDGQNEKRDTILSSLVTAVQDLSGKFDSHSKETQDALRAAKRGRL